MKKKLLIFFVLTIVLSFSFGLIACENQNTKENNSKQYALYQTYVVNAEEKGETPLSYEEWLASIKGEKGEKGDTGLQGEQGQAGQDGKGIVSVEKTSTNGNIDTYTITFTDNTTTTFTITNGVNGQNG